MILLRSLRLEEGEELGALRKKAARKLGLPENEILSLRPVKISLDARKKNDIHYNCAVALTLRRGEERALRRGAEPYEEPRYEIPRVESSERPVVAGFGPAGMFAALALARAGAKPIVLERGQDVDTRLRDVEAFRKGGALDPESNVQFGEGGAGTFSDGKLNTSTHDRRIFWVLREFAAHGAGESVTWDSKPHIGTDVLVDVVRSIRQEICSLGGELRFGARLDGLEAEGGALTGVKVTQNGEEYRLPCRHLILALGHSARDSFEMLHALGIPMERKSFSMGLRIEHLQADIDRAQYGRERGKLPPADYSLSVHLPDGASAYTFCMCPGGQVFAAASETGGVVTNGMSYSDRGGENANAALLVTLHAEDFPGEGVLAGVEWQRQIERAAFAYSGSYRAPAQLAGDFLAHRKSTGPGRVKPSYAPGVAWAELHEILPERITDVLERALPELGKRLRGFDDPEAVLTAPETRSSSPVRILRDETLQSALRGLYPCGEGAGYAGGITSAAVDGLRCAEAVLLGLQIQNRSEGSKR